MAEAPTPDSSAKTRDQAEAWAPSEGAGSFLPFFLAGEESPDYASFLALVKEAGRHLNSFAPPEGFVPEGPAPEMPLSPDAAKALGAGSLRDFFSLALEGEEGQAVKNLEGRLPAFFPQGPESVRPALAFIEAKCANISTALAELKKSWPRGENGLEAAVRPLESTLNALKENQAGLTRVERDLWPRMKQEALEWPKDSKALWSKAQSLKQSVAPLLRITRAEGGEGGAIQADRSRRSLTLAVMELKTQVEQARKVDEGDGAWDLAYEALLTDLDDYLAVAVDGGQGGRDWNADSRRISEGLINLEKEDRRLRDETARAAEALQLSLEALVEVETRLSGHHGSEMLDGLETVGRGIEALWRSTIERRRQLARIYFTVPSRLGRPVYLEKSMMATAQALGRTQSLLEDLRHQLSLAGGKLSTTHRLRSEGKALAEKLSRPKHRSARLKVARKRLGLLAGVVDQRLSLDAAKDELENAVAKGEEAERRLNQGRSENSRMYRELKAASLERDRLADQLSSAHQKLGEAGLVKARLLKVFAHKSAIWDEIERSRQKLLADNEALKIEKGELKIKRARLAELYTRERRELKELTAEMKETQAEAARAQEFAKLRHELEKRLDETRREKDAVTARSREIETQLQERAAQLAAAVAQADSLSVELSRHREELAEASRARQNLGEQAAALRRRQDLLVQAHSSLQKAYRRRGGQLARSETDRGALTVKLNKQKRNLLRLVAVRQQLRAELGAARLRIVDLEKEREDIFARLKDAQSDLLKTDAEQSDLSGLAENLVEERNFLRRQIEAVDRDKDELSRRLESAEEDGNLKAARLAGLEDEKNRLAFLLAELEQRNEELSGQLAGLETKVSRELFPFIKILGEALWRSEAQLKRARSASTRLMERFQLEFEVKEANLRLQAAGRELELSAGARAEKRELEKRLEATDAERQTLSDQNVKLRRAIGMMKDRRSAQRDESRTLSDQNVKLRRAIGTMKARHSIQLDESRSRNENLESLLGGQEKELKLQKDKLAQLEPLVTYFIASADIEGESGPSGLDPQLVAYLRQAGKALNSELSSEDLAEAQGRDLGGLALEGAEPAEPPLVALLKARLKEIQPLVTFLARSYVGSVAELAQARQDRSALSEELARARREGERSLAELNKLRDEDARMRAELGRARQDNSIMGGRIDLAESTRSMLEATVSAREAELSEAREKAGELARERDQLQRNLEERKKEIGLLKSELAQADRDLTENDGRLEAAWAAMNYLGARASDTLGSLKSKYEAQSRQVESLNLELRRRESVINGLEERQNKLALLYWALVTKASTAEPGQLAAQMPDSAARLPLRENRPTLLEAASDFDPGLIEFGGPMIRPDHPGRSGGYGLGRGLMEGVKKVARRSLFTLILAGGLVMAGPLGAEASVAAQTRGDLIVPSAREADQPLNSRLDSTYLGRTVSLEMVGADLRLAGRPAVEKRLMEMVSDLADGHGLSNGEFLRLVRSAKGPEDTLHLGEFKGRQGALDLLAHHLPKLSRQMALWPPDILKAEKVSALMKSAADFKPAEGGFWERMYFDLTAAGRDSGEALEFLLEALDQKRIMAEALRPEYAGRLAPFPQLENLGPDRFIGFMADYISGNWSHLSGRGRQQAARRLAGDIYFAARLFKLPTTLLSALIYEEAESDRIDFFRRGSTCSIHARAADLADLTKSFTLVWQEGRPPLCDLDEALAASEKEAFVENVYRRKMALVMAYNKSMNSSNDLFADIE